MNTPSPCDKCKLLYYDATLKDDAAYLAVCKVGEILGNLNCIYFDMGEMMKRYAIIEIPARVLANEYLAYGAWYPILTGPVELMQEACKEAGVKLRIPKIGDWVMYGEGTWHKVVVESDNWEIRPVIPAPEPEKEKPCPNCQGIKPGQAVWSTIYTRYTRCNKCGRPESEWTYAKDRWTAEWQVADPGGIGCGGTGGPL